MSDITKCTDIKCPSKDKCYRRTATSSEYQSYADFNREPDAAKCDHFWPTVAKLATVQSISNA